ncbi:hypothetical protein SAMN06296386_1142 [Lachnospiraceae bacterium]|nr:hypothetical protein SAMN06296386_1142 [Lachnospiraceae bacterium]
MNIALRNGIALCALTAEEIDEVCSFSYDEFLKVYDEEKVITRDRLRTAKSFGHEICKFCAKVFNIDTAANVNFMIRNFNEKRVIVSLSEAFTVEGEDILSEMEDIELKSVSIAEHMNSGEKDELDFKLEDAVNKIIAEERRMRELKELYSHKLDEIHAFDLNNKKAIEKLLFDVKNAKITEDFSAPCVQCFRFFTQDGFLDAQSFSDKWLKDYDYTFSITKTRNGRNGEIYARIKYPDITEARKAQLLLAEFAEAVKGIKGETFQRKN